MSPSHFTSAIRMASACSVYSVILFSEVNFNDPRLLTKPACIPEFMLPDSGCLPKQENAMRSATTNDFSCFQEIASQMNCSEEVRPPSYVIYRLSNHFRGRTVRIGPDNGMHKQAGQTSRRFNSSCNPYLLPFLISISMIQDRIHIVRSLG